MKTEKRNGLLMLIGGGFAIILCLLACRHEDMI